MSYQRVEHPELKLHQLFIENLTQLENNLKTLCTMSKKYATCVYSVGLKLDDQSQR